MRLLYPSVRDQRWPQVWSLSDFEYLCMKNENWHSWMWAVTLWALPTVALLWSLYTMGPSQRKWISGGQALRFPAQPYFLYHLCFLIYPKRRKQRQSAAAAAIANRYSCGHASLALVDCSPKTKSRTSPFSLKLLCVENLVTSTGKVINTGK